MFDYFGQKRAYPKEEVAQFVEQINFIIERDTERQARLTLEQQAQWAALPAMIRAHTSENMFLEPDRPIAHLLRHDSTFLNINHETNKDSECK